MWFDLKTVWGARHALFMLPMACYSVGYFGNIIADRLTGTDASLWRRMLIAAALTAIGVLAVVYALNGLAIGY